jgi:hypothetical protein
MKKRLSFIVAVVFSICLLSYFNAGEKSSIQYAKSNIQYADLFVIIIGPPVKTSGKKTKPVISPTKKRVATTVYRTMA